MSGSVESGHPRRSPVEQYRFDLQRPGFVADSAQRAAIDELQLVYESLVERESARGGWFSRLWRRRREELPVRGLYLWGGVGRGKTYLMDLFYESLPFERKQRLHFHRFMRFVHHELESLKGTQNPLQRIADGFAARSRVLCFDEFFVADIADAMILGTLMAELFRRGVTLVATSNIAPDQLYRDGLQRERFVPAIEQIKRYAAVMKIDGGTDYRLRTLERLMLYYTPLDERAEAAMLSAFRRLVPEEAEVSRDASLEVESRQIRVRMVADDVAWFDFRALCDIPRSQNDYIELAREYHTVLVSDIPAFDGIDDLVRRFINLVDEFYDRGVKMILSAEVPLEDLYLGGRLHFEFERTRSRLLEMQSSEYLALPHKP